MKKTVQAQHIASALFHATHDQPQEYAEKVLDATLDYIETAHMHRALPDILNAYTDLVTEHEKGDAITVISRYPLEQKQLETIKTLVQKRYALERCYLVNEIKSTLLGGIQIIYHDRVLDMSVDHRLQQLSDQLAHA